VGRILEDESEEFMGQKTTRDYFVEWFWLILAVIFAIFMRGRLGSVTYDKAVFLACIFVVGAVMAKSAIIMWKNATAKIIFNYGHSTTDGEIIPAGSFGILRPAVKAYQWYFKLPGAYVAPLDALHKAGPNILINAKMDMVGLDEMPIEARTVIREKNIKGPYFLGFADDEQYSKVLDDPEQASGLARPDVSYLIDEIKKVNKQVTLRERILSGDVRAIEDYVAGASRISSRAKGDIWESLKKVVQE